jgi:hypothetical protein
MVLNVAELLDIAQTVSLISKPKKLNILLDFVRLLCNTFNRILMKC